MAKGVSFLSPEVQETTQSKLEKVFNFLMIIKLMSALPTHAHPPLADFSYTTSQSLCKDMGVKVMLYTGF